MNQLTLPEQAHLMHDPYGSATLVNADERHRMNMQFALHTTPLLGRAMTMLNGPQGLKLLDVGSGYGAVLSAFNAMDALPERLGLMDCNPGLLALARDRALQAGVRVAAHAAAIDAQPVPAALCGNDVVLCSFTATHLRDLDGALAHMAGALRPGGLLVLTDVDYCASAAWDDEAAEDCLWQVQKKLLVRDLSGALPRLALRHGLRPVPALSCTDAFQVYEGAHAVRDMALAFVANFHDDDPAKAAWHRMGPRAAVALRRMNHLYSRA